LPKIVFRESFCQFYPGIACILVLNIFFSNRLAHSSHAPALNKASQDVLHSSEWQYVVDPSGSFLQFIRVDPPGRCLCPTCCMNYPAKMDLTDRLKTWKMDYGGDFKSDKATTANTFLLVVSVMEPGSAPSASKTKTRQTNAINRDFILTVDGTMRLDLLNHIVGSAYKSCDCSRTLDLKDENLWILARLN
jgi:hypothetical protein